MCMNEQESDLIVLVGGSGLPADVRTSSPKSLLFVSGSVDHTHPPLLIFAVLFGNNLGISIRYKCYKAVEAFLAY